jgi:hypothetical protein
MISNFPVSLRHPVPPIYKPEALPPHLACFIPPGYKPEALPPHPACLIPPRYKPEALPPHPACFIPPGYKTEALPPHPACFILSLKLGTENGKGESWMLWSNEYHGQTRWNPPPHSLPVRLSLWCWATWPSEHIQGISILGNMCNIITQ